MIVDIKGVGKKSRRKGQGLTEYGLILGVMAIAALASLSNTGNTISAYFNTIASAIQRPAGN